VSERRRTRAGGDAAPRGTPDRTDPQRSTTPQRDEQGGAVPAPAGEGATRYGDMKLPHERDESARGASEAAGDRDGTRAVTRQAAEDVASGQQDTDCYNANAPRYKSREGGT
jgi:hypothetical protein